MYSRNSIFLKMGLNLLSAMGLRTGILALLFLLPSGWCNFTCPFNEQCRCKKEPTYADFSEIICDGVPLSKFPAFPNTRVETLQVSESGIQLIEDSSFGELIAHTVILDRNDIFSIANNSFTRFSNTLKVLSLNDNKLSEIPINALSPLEILKTLRIERNQISSVIITDWKNLKNSLTELNLNNNDIDSIPLNPETSLSNIRNLEDLHLSGNLLQTLEANSVPYSLKILNASNNYIKTFPNDILNVLQNLNTLDLSENNIETLTDHQFKTRINLETLNLSYNHLKNIKKSFGDVVKINKLDLSINNITEIEKEAFLGLDSKEINLSANNLSKIDDSSFKGVEQTLEKLDLSHNKFTKVPHALKDLKSLKKLNFAYNRLSRVKNSLYYSGELKKLSLAGNFLEVFPVDCLSPLHSLTSLDLSHNKIADVRKSDFKTWGKNLEKLFMQSNSLFYLGDGTFEYTPKLAEMSLSYNTIGDMSLNAFKNLNKIEKLDISFSLKGYGFPTPLLSMTSLVYLALDNNNINSISKDITKLSKLETLILDFNRIKDIESSTFDSKAHKYLSDIRLSFNFINKIESNTFTELNSLQSISLHDNKIMKLSEYGFINLPQNLSIYLSGNKIDNIEKHAFSSLPKLKILDLHNNNIQVFDYNIFQNVTSESEPMTLNLSSNRIELLKVPDYTRVPVYISHLDLDHNKISKIPEKLVEIQTSLRVLTLRYNEITSLESQNLYSMVALEKLSLAHNKITAIKDDAFVSLKKLQILNISHNHIEEIPAGLFRSLESLRVLDLSSNNIRLISQTAFDNTKIEHLYLSNNKITSIPPSAFLNIGKTLRILDLSYNQIDNFDSMFFRYAPMLQNLNLCNNNLTGDNLVAFKNTSLFKLELCGNYLNQIPADSFSNSSNLYELNLASTGLQDFPNLTLPNLSNLRISSNKIKNLAGSPSSGLPKLRKLFLNNNEISNLNGINWIQVPHLRSLDLSNNPIKILDKPCFFQLYNLRELNIQHLKHIDRLESGIFMDLDKLTSLKVDFESRIGLNLNQTIGHLKYLRELSLNVVDSKFSEDLPEQMPWKLRSLEITGGNVKYIDPLSIKSLKAFHNFNLKITRTAMNKFPKHFFNRFKGKQFKLDLSYNEIENVGPEIFYNTLGDIRRHGTKAFSGGIDVRRNQLACGCQVKWFAEWLRRYLVEVLDVNRMPAGERLALIEEMKELTCFEKKTEQRFPILTYDLSTDEKLCGIIVNVPKPPPTKDSAQKSESLAILIASVVFFSHAFTQWTTL